MKNVNNAALIAAIAIATLFRLGLSSVSFAAAQAPTVTPWPAAVATATAAANLQTQAQAQRSQADSLQRQADAARAALGGFQTGIHKKAYRELIGHLGLVETIQDRDPVQQLAIPSEEVLNRFHVDIRYVTAHGPDSFTGGIEINERAGRRWHDLRDEFGVVWSMPEDQMLFMDISYHPLADATLRDVEAYSFPDGGDPSRFTGVREKALAIRQQTPYALSSGICGVTYEICWYMRGLEKGFMDMMENPAFCEALIVVHY